MKTLEELKGMTQEDLVRLVQELQEKLAKEKAESEKYLQWWNKKNKDYEDFKVMLTNLLNLTK